MDIEILKFRVEDGTYLDGILKKGKANTKVIVCVHGMVSDCFRKREKVLAEEAIKHNIDTFVFNNRGSNIMRFLKNNSVSGKNIGGSAYENVYDSYYDIKGAIQEMLKMGYKEIYLYGHSLGSTKLVYTYKKLLDENDIVCKNIKAIILLSLVDLMNCFKFLSKDKFEYYCNYALEQEKIGNELNMMPEEAFLYPLSVRSFLTYTRNNEELNFARYSDKNYDFKELKLIKIPLFLRWGTVNEFIEQKPEDLKYLLTRKLENDNLDINFIDGADHNYHEKEEKLVGQIIDFLLNIKK